VLVQATLPPVFADSLVRPAQRCEGERGNCRKIANHAAPEACGTDRKINPRPPAQRFMKPPLSRYIALAQRRTMVLMSRRAPLLEKLYLKEQPAY
jgi:hypothetical protein